SAGRPIQRIEVGDSKPIKAALADWRHQIEQRREQDSPQAAGKLRRLLWDKLAAALPADTRTVFLAPDAALHRLPWAALPGSKPGTILLEDYSLAVVPHGPFLLAQLRSQKRFGQGTGVPLAVGGVNYSDTPAALPDSVARGPSRDGAALPWKELKGSQRELELLQKVYGTGIVALTGPEAGV